MKRWIALLLLLTVMLGALAGCGGGNSITVDRGSSSSKQDDEDERGSDKEKDHDSEEPEVRPMELEQPLLLIREDGLWALPDLTGGEAVQVVEAGENPIERCGYTNDGRHLWFTGPDLGTYLLEADSILSGSRSIAELTPWDADKAIGCVWDDCLVLCSSIKPEDDRNMSLRRVDGEKELLADEFNKMQFDPHPNGIGHLNGREFYFYMVTEGAEKIVNTRIHRVTQADGFYFNVNGTYVDWPRAIGYSDYQEHQTIIDDVEYAWMTEAGLVYLKMEDGALNCSVFDGREERLLARSVASYRCDTKSIFEEWTARYYPDGIFLNFNASEFTYTGAQVYDPRADRFLTLEPAAAEFLETTVDPGSYSHFMVAGDVAYLYTSADGVRTLYGAEVRNDTVTDFVVLEDNVAKMLNAVPTILHCDTALYYMEADGGLSLKKLSGMGVETVMTDAAKGTVSLYEDDTFVVGRKTADDVPERVLVTPKGESVLGQELKVYYRLENGDFLLLGQNGDLNLWSRGKTTLLARGVSKLAALPETMPVVELE